MIKPPAKTRIVEAGVGQRVTLQNPVQPDSMHKAELHTRLYALSRQQGDEDAMRAEFRSLVLEQPGTIGVAHILLDESGEWNLSAEHCSGRVPRREDFVEKFAKCCTATIQRNSIQIEGFLGLESIYVPIQMTGSRPEVLMVLTSEKQATRTLFLMETVAAYFTLWLKEARSQSSGWKLNSLAALVDLVSQIESQQTVSGACLVTASELARHLKCQQVAVGVLRRGHLKVEAVSGNADLDENSDSIQTLETALNECLLREEPGIWPPADDDDPHLLLAHRQAATELQSEAVLGCRLETVGGKTVGALILMASQELVRSDRLPNFVNAARPRIASALDVVRRAEISRWQKLCRKLGEQAKTVKGRVWYSVAVLMLAVMLVPVPYRVRCGCVTEPTQRRYAVAPFDGLVKRGYVEPGDVVDEGQMLAEMDGQSLRFELAGVTAELNQARKKRELELSGRNVPASLLADLESQRLKARQQQLEFQQDQIEIRSPFNGVVLSGSLERAEGASVQTGEVLFEVAPLKSLKVEVAIPAEEIAHAAVGQSTRIWIEGLESQSFTGTISRIHPQSELRDARNVFVAEVTIENPDERLRPGMQGHARIDCKARPLAWNLFHKPCQFLVSRLTWW